MSFSETPLEGTLSRIEEELSSRLFSQERYLIFTLTEQNTQNEYQLFIPDTDSKSIYLDNIIQAFHRKEEIKFKGTYSYDTEDHLLSDICLSFKKPFISLKKDKDKSLEAYKGLLSVGDTHEVYEIFNFQCWRRTTFKISKI